MSKVSINVKNDDILQQIMDTFLDITFQVCKTRFDKVKSNLINDSVLLTSKELVDLRDLINSKNIIKNSKNELIVNFLHKLVTMLNDEFLNPNYRFMIGSTIVTKFKIITKVYDCVMVKMK
jgi:hypothetical protein